MASTRRHPQPLQFKLRTLLLLMLVICTVLAWFTARLHSGLRQRDAVAEIVNAGGFVKYDYERSPTGEGFTRWAQPAEPAWLRRILGDDFLHRVVFVAFINRNELTDDDLACLRDLPQLQCLSIDRGQITDDGLRHLGSLTNLEALTLARVEISDAGLAQLEGLRRLQSLNLFGTAITGTGLEYLASLPQLRRLNLAYTKLADDELVSLRACRRLEEVRLRGSDITDAALTHLEGLPVLRRIDLVATKVTDAGVEEYRQAWPHVRVSR